MPEHGFSLTRLFPYKDRIVDFTVPSLCGKILVRGNPYSGMVFAVCMSAGIPSHFALTA